eukprot:5564283-Amphidinium_carterae.1
MASDELALDAVLKDVDVAHEAMYLANQVSPAKTSLNSIIEFLAWQRPNPRPAQFPADFEDLLQT